MSKIKITALSLALLASACFTAGPAQAQSANVNIDVNKAVDQTVGGLNNLILEWGNLYTPVLGDPNMTDTDADSDSDFVLCGGDGMDQDPTLDMTDSAGEDPKVTDPAGPDAGSGAPAGKMTVPNAKDPTVTDPVGPDAGDMAHGPDGRSG